MVGKYIAILSSNKLQYKLGDLLNCLKHQKRKNSMSKAILFSRVSTPGQDTTSQNNELLNEAHRCGYDDDHIISIDFTESAIKLKFGERQGLLKLKEYIENDKDIDCVFIYEISRLSRQNTMLYEIRDYLIQHGVNLICLKPYMKLLEDGKMSQTASILFSLFSTFAESEMLIKRERFVRGKQELRNQCKKFSGAVVFGYMKDKDKRCVPHPVNGKVVVDLFNHYLEDSCSSVYECYKYACVKYPGLFKVVNYTRDHRKMMSLLTKKTFIGNWCYPALITEETFNKAQDKMAKAKCHPRYESKCKILGRGKVFCGHCGRMLTGVGGSVKAYNCSYKDGQHNMTVNVEIVDELIWDETRVIANINASIDNNTKIVELNEQINGKQILLDDYKRNLEDVEQKMTKLLDLYMNNKVNDKIYESRYTDLTQDEVKIKKHINTLETEISSLHDILDKSQKDLLNIKSVNYDSIDSFEVRQELVRKYIDKVIITKLENKIYDIRFTYNSGILIVQEGHYRYQGKNQNKKDWRINADGTEDLLRGNVKKG